VGFKCGLEIWKVSQSGAMLGSLSAISLLNFFNSYPAIIKEGTATTGGLAGPAVQMVVSAGRLFLWQACYFARASAHSFLAILACDFTL